MSTVTLNCAKGAGDFLRLRFWGTVLLMLGALLAFSAGSAFAAPLAGTSIGNQASASYKDFNNVDRITVSNSVSTLVTAVAAGTLTQTQSKVGAPGQTLAFPHTITNTGNSPSTFGMTIGAIGNGPATFNPQPASGTSIFADANCDGQADSNIVISEVGPVAPGAQACFVVQATILGTAAGGVVGTISVAATSGISNAALTGSANTDTVTVSANAVINVTKSISISTGPTGTIATYQLTYRNTGTVSAGNVVIADTLPSGATYVAGSGRWSVTTGTALTDVSTDTEGTAPNQIDYGTAGVATGGSVVAILARVDPGVQGVIEFQAQINGTQSTVFNHANWCYSDIGLVGTTLPAAVATACNSIRASFGAGALGIADITGANGVTTATNTNQTNIVPFYIPSIGATGAVVYNDNGTISTDGGTLVTLADAIALAAADVNVAVATAGQGTLATWDTFVWNTGGATDTYNVSVLGAAFTNFPAGTTFLLFRNDNATPLTDSNGDGAIDTGPVAAGAFYKVRVVAVLPPSGAAGTYNAILSAQSTNTTTATNLVAVRAVIVGSRVDLTNYGGGGAGQSAAGVGGPVTTVTANPGTVATFGLTVQNTGSVADSYDLSFNVGNGAYAGTSPYAFTTPGTLPGGYALAFHRDNGATCAPAQRGAQISNTGVIAAGGTVNICALVTIPNGAVVATTQFFFRALSPTTFANNDFLTSSGDVKNDALTINTFRSVSIAPNNSGQGFPGGSVQYCHTVSNAGNTPEAALVVTQSNQSLNGVSGWAQFATVYVDTNNNCVLDGVESATPLTTTVNLAALAAGVSRNLIVVVQVPGAASAGQTNLNTFTLSGSTGITNAVATDTTTVVLGQVSLVKDQVVDAACATVFNAATLDALGTFTQSQLSAAPAACVIYRVRATNVGTQNVTGVTINDVAPPNTSLHAGAISGAVNVCVPANAAPNVSCNVAGALSGGATTTMYFRVQITP